MGRITKQQNRMLHAFIREWAEAHAEKGLTMGYVMSQLFEMLPDEESAKVYVKRMIKKHWEIDSTQKLSNQQLSSLYESLRLSAAKNDIEMTVPEDHYSYKNN